MSENIYKENIFSKIIKGEIPAKKVFEDDDVLCFHDINPKAKTHVLLIPKKNYIDFEDFSNNSTPLELANFFKKAAYIANEKLNLKSYKILSNKGAKAGQEVLHFHLHILGY